MNLCELRPAEGSREKNWRRGRGHATGNGKTAVRCLCTEDSLKEASHAETAKKSLLSTFPC